MAKKTVKPVKKRRKLRLKKSVRWTIAALMMVSAIIVAAVPVRQVEAESVTTDEWDTIYTELKGSPVADLSVPAETDSDKLYYAYPIKEDSITIADINHNPHIYYEIDQTGMGDYIIPIYEMQKTDMDKESGILNKYTGGGYSDYHPEQIEGKYTINLGKKVGYTDSTVGADEVIDEYVYQAEDLSYKKRVEYLRKGDSNSDYMEVYDTPVVEDEENPGSFIDAGIPVRVGYFSNKYKYVSAIADEAFSGASNFQRIKLPYYAVNIGNKAFYGCGYLEEIDIGTEIKTIGNQAFEGCSGLSVVNFDDVCPLETIGTLAFSGTNIGTLELPKTVNTIGPGAFYYCRSLNFSEADKDALFNKLNAESIENQVSIGNYLFARCLGLQHMMLDKCIKPETLTNAKGMFIGCDALLDVEYPANFTSNVIKGSFKGDGLLEYIKFNDVNATIDPAAKYEFVTNDNLSYAQLEDPSKEVNVSNSFYIWGPHINENPKAYEYASKSSNIYRYNPDNYVITLGGYTFDFDADSQTINGILKIWDEDASETLTIPSTTIGDKVMTNIGSNFSDNITSTAKPTSIIIPPNITNVEDTAFSGIGSLKHVRIDTAGINLGTAAFNGCTNLETVDFNQQEGTSGETVIGESCFNSCPNLKLIDLRDYGYDDSTDNNVNVTSVGPNAFYTGRTSPIVDTAFISKYTDSDESVYLIVHGKIPMGQSMDYSPYAFSVSEGNKVSNYEEAYVTYASGNPWNITCKYDSNLGGTSLLAYPTLETVVSDDGTKIGDLVDRYAADPNSVSDHQREIINYAKNITVPAGVKYIDNADNTLRTSRYPYITHVNDGETGTGSGTQYAGSDGLSSLELYNVSRLPQTSYTEDKDNAYLNTTLSNNHDLTRVTFHSDVTDLALLPFYNDINLSEVIFNGEQDPSSDNPRFECINGIIYSTTDGTTYKIEEVLPIRGTQNSGTSKVIPDPSDSVEVEHISKVTSINPAAFQNCDGISEVNLRSAADLKEIPEYCFYDCDGLTSVSLPDELTAVNTQAFARCDPNILHIYNYSHFSTIDTNAFDGDKIVWFHGYDPSSTKTFYDKNNKATFKAAHEIEDMKWDPIDKCFVSFYDSDGTTLVTTAEVENGGTLYELPDAAKPENMEKEGHKFNGWRIQGSGDPLTIPYNNITESFSVIADYDSVTAVFIDTKGNNFGTKVFPRGSVITQEGLSDIVAKAQEIGVIDSWNPQLPFEVKADTPANLSFTISYKADDKVSVIFYAVEDGYQYQMYYPSNQRLDLVNVPPAVQMHVNSMTGKTFLGWDPSIPYDLGGPEHEYYFKAVYKDNSSTGSSTSGSSTSGSSTSGSSTSGSSTSGSSTSGSSTSGGSSGSSSSKSSSSSSSSRSSSSSAGTSSSNVNSSTTPVVVSGAVSGYTPQGNAGNISSGGGNSGGGNTGGGTPRGSGNTNVISTTPGISDVGKMSATV
nr:leucine-rich repeat domain-containing protein [Lachnospiraceae bacterium]